MSQDSKTLKIVCLIGLFFGIALALLSIPLYVQGHPIYGTILLVLGILAAVSSFRGAKAANTPSTAGKTTPLLGVEAAAGGISIPLGSVAAIESAPSPIVVVCGALLLVLGIIAAVFSNRVYQKSLK